jgi:hypothetical protein
VFFDNKNTLHNTKSQKKFPNQVMEKSLDGFIARHHLSIFCIVKY